MTSKKQLEKLEAAYADDLKVTDHAEQDRVITARVLYLVQGLAMFTEALAQMSTAALNGEFRALAGDTSVLGEMLERVEYAGNQLVGLQREYAASRSNA